MTICCGARACFVLMSVGKLQKPRMSGVDSLKGFGTLQDPRHPHPTHTSVWSRGFNPDNDLFCDRITEMSVFYETSQMVKTSLLDNKPVDDISSIFSHLQTA